MPMVGFIANEVLTHSKIYHFHKSGWLCKGCMYIVKFQMSGRTQNVDDEVPISLLYNQMNIFHNAILDATKEFINLAGQLFSVR